jgi:hypothetical protein
MLLLALASAVEDHFRPMKYIAATAAKIMRFNLIILLHNLLLDHPGVSLRRKQVTVQLKMQASNGGNLLSRHLKTTPLVDTLYLNSPLVHRVNLAIYTGPPLSSQIPIISTRHPVNQQG